MVDRTLGITSRRGRVLCRAAFWMAAVCVGLGPASLQGQQVHWIWTASQDGARVPLGSCYFRKAFRMLDPERGQLQIAANDRMEVYLNGVHLGTVTGGGQMKRFDIGPQMIAGVNVVAVKVDNLEGKTAGLAAAIVVKEKNEKQWRMMPSDDHWRASTDPRGTWMSLSFDDSSWGLCQNLQGDDPSSNAPQTAAAASAPPSADSAAASADNAAGHDPSEPNATDLTAQAIVSKSAVPVMPAVQKKPVPEMAGDQPSVPTSNASTNPPPETREPAPAPATESAASPDVSAAAASESGGEKVEGASSDLGSSWSAPPINTPDKAQPDRSGIELPPIVSPRGMDRAASPAPPSAFAPPVVPAPATTAPPAAPAAESAAALAEPQFQIDPEFEVSIVSDGTLGSYLAMEFDEFGRLIVSCENGGLARIDFNAAPADPNRTQKICDQVKNCQGILPLNGKLYVTGEGLQGWGLYLLSDANGDSTFESVELIARFEGTNAEHGPHGLTLGPDGNMYVIVGNHSRLAQPVAATSPYAHPYEADVVPRVEDPGGHAVGIRAPGGTILRMPIQTREFEQVAGGIRNAYDLAFDAQGELFFHDSDMESDVGTPWYRPTMLFQLVAGGEYGWRSGWAKYPTFYLDCLSPADSTGRGSPTGATFYHHLAFPTRFHDALFLADWSEGRILVTKLTRHGSLSRGQTRPFLAAAALNVTDLAVGPDGALYFCTGGRGTQGSIGRIAWRGQVPAEVANPPTPLLRVLTFPQPESAWARQGLAKMRKQAGPQWSTMLNQAVLDPNLQVKYRVRALQIMGLYGPTPTPQLLEQLAGDSQVEVRVAAAKMLGMRPAAQVQTTLERLVADADPWVRRVACESLLRCNAQVSHRLLLNPLQSLDHGEAFAARRLLERIPAEQWRDEILASTQPRLFLQGATALLIAAPDLDTSYTVLARTAEFFDGFVADSEFIDFLRVIQLALTQAAVDPAKIPAFAQRIAEEFPSSNAMINRELAKIMAYLQIVDIDHRYAEYLTEATDPVEQRLMVAMMLQTMADRLDSTDRIAVLGFLEETLASHSGGGSYEGYLSAAASHVAESLTAKEWEIVWSKGAAWPNALTAALFRLPADADETTRARLIEIDQQAQARQDASTRTLRAGIAAVLLSSEEPAALEYVIDMLATLHEPIVIESLLALREIDYRPQQPAQWRAVLSAAEAHPGVAAAAAISLLETWTGESHGDGDAEPRATLDHWRSWFAEKYPQEQPISTSATPHTTAWTVETLLAELRNDRGSRDAARGEKLFQQAQCARCHRFGNIGEGSGPDLTSIGRRFSIREIVESTLAPSLVVSDQYRGKRITTLDGKVIAGLLTIQADGRWVVTPSDGIRQIIAPDQVDNVEDLQESTMPEGLLNSLSSSEIADLLHYLTADNPDRFAQTPR